MTLEEIKNLDFDGIEKRTAEIRTEMEAEGADIEALTAEVDAMEARKKELNDAIEERKALEARVALGTPIEKPKEETHKMTLEEVRKSHEYNAAYADYIKTGKQDEVRALLTDLVEGGTVPVPTMISDAIATAWENTTLVRRINKLQISGSYTAVFELSATGAAVHVEGSDAPKEETITFGQVKIEPEYIKKWITVSDKVLSLKGEAFLNYLNQEITYQIDKLADSLLVDAIKKAPATSSATAAGVPAVTTNAIAADTIFSGLALLSDEAASPVAIMTKATYFNKFMALKDSTGRPIYDIVSANGAPTYYINGIEVIFNSAVGDDTIIVGDLNGALAVVPNGDSVEFVTDPYSLAEKNLVKIVGKELIGLDVVRPDFFVKITVGAAG